MDDYGTYRLQTVSNPLTEQELLEKHATAVYNLALRLTGNPADAEDLAQDALLRALRSLSGFRGDSSIATWLYRVTVNTWKNRVRSESRRGSDKTASLEAFVSEDHGGEPPFKADDPPLDAPLEAQERERAVQRALLELDEESLTVVLLRDMEGLSYDEIAKAIEAPEGTVKSRLSRAREALKEKLKKFVQS